MEIKCVSCGGYTENDQEIAGMSAEILLRWIKVDEVHSRPQQCHLHAGPCGPIPVHLSQVHPVRGPNDRLRLHHGRGDQHVTNQNMAETMCAKL